jgi:hypothetical protein
MTSSMLKILALFFMLIDHIGSFIPGLPVDRKTLRTYFYILFCMGFYIYK